MKEITNLLKAHGIKVSSNRIAKADVQKAIEIIIADSARYFHCTSKEVAKKILSGGFDKSYKMSGSNSPGGRFDDDEQWFNYYHLFMKAYSKEEIEEMKRVLWDNKISEFDRGTWIREKWSSDFGDNWSTIWLGKNKVFPAYGEVALEFIPAGKDIIIHDFDDYYCALHFNRIVPSSQFKLIGKFDPEWRKKGNFECEDAIDWSEAKKHILELTAIK